LFFYSSGRWPSYFAAIIYIKTKNANFKKTQLKITRHERVTSSNARESFSL